MPPPPKWSLVPKVIVGAMLLIGTILITTAVNVLVFRSDDDAAHPSPPPTAVASATPSSATSPSGTSPSGECLSPKELRTGLQVNWEVNRLRPGAEVVAAPDGAPEVIIHHADGSNSRITYGEFIEISKEAARACRAEL